MHGVPAKPHSFIVTKEHRRYVEFANAVRRSKTIGLCYGPAGIGKTVSALRLSNWNVIAPELGAIHWEDADAKIAAVCARFGTVFHTARVGATWRQFRDELGQDMYRFGCLVSRDTEIRTGQKVRDASPVELVVIDEAERLNAVCFEWIRDEFDRNAMGVILTGMPGIEKRLSRYPQLYSRVGFAHEYRPLQKEELVFILQHHWKKLSLELNEDEFTDAQAIAAIVRVTSGNFRLLQRLFGQIERVMKINELSSLTEDVIEAARSTLVIGAT